MSTWRELGDDFRQGILLYTEKLPITEPQIMRWLTRAMNAFQTRTRIVEGTKNLTSGDSYALGDDILEIRTVVDSDGAQLVLVGYDQFKDIVDRSQAGYYGYHETPQHWSWRKDPAYLSDYGNVSRICTVWENSLLRYPEGADATIEVRYVKNLHPISSASSQWTNWYPLDTNFPNQYDTTEPPDQFRTWEDAIVAHAIGLYLESIGNPNYEIYNRRYQQYISDAIRLTPVLYREMVSPYNISPFSS